MHALWSVLPLLLLALQKHGAEVEGETVGGDRLCQQSTYFIQEYHVHKGKGNHDPMRHSKNANRTGVHLASPAYQENLMKQLKVSRQQHVREKNERLKDLQLYMEWMNYAKQGGARNNATVLEDQLRAHARRLRIDIDNIHAAADTQLPEYGYQDEDTGANSLHGDTAGISEQLNAIQEQMHHLEKTIAAARSKQQEFQKSHRSLALNYRVLQKDLRKSEAQNSRFQLYHQSEMQKLRWKIANETELWQAGIQHLDNQLFCSKPENKQDLLCSTALLRHKGFTFKRPGPFDKTSLGNDVLHLSKKGKTKFVYNRISKPQSSYTRSPGQHMALTTTDNSLTEAGIEVTQYYLDALKSERPRDCSDIDIWTQRRTPLQTIYLRERSFPVQVYCEDGWIVIQRNTATETPSPDLWSAYKDGFELPAKDGGGDAHYWLGNEYLHELTNQRAYKLRVDMIRESDSLPLLSEYENVRVDSERDFYRLHVDGLSGDAASVVNNVFSTKDHYQDRRYGIMASDYLSGWWYPHRSPARELITHFPSPCFPHLNHPHPWYCSRGGLQYLKSVTMKIRPTR